MNRLYYGDNLDVLRGCIADESVDLVYLDPPFNSQATYNVLFKSTAGEKSRAQIEAFEDTWHWGDEAELAFDGVMSRPQHRRGGNAPRHAGVPEGERHDGVPVHDGRSPLELRRVLKPTGSLYLHCDPTASHYLKILMDAIFGAAEFPRRKSSGSERAPHGNVSRGYGDVMDTSCTIRRASKPTWNQIYGPYSEEAHRHEVHLQGPGWHGYSRPSDLSESRRAPEPQYEYKGYKPHPNGWAISREKMDAVRQRGPDLVSSERTDASG